MTIGLLSAEIYRVRKCFRLLSSIKEKVLDTGLFNNGVEL